MSSNSQASRFRITRNKLLFVLRSLRKIATIAPRPLFKLKDGGMVAFDRTTPQAYSYFQCGADFFEVAPDTEQSFYISDEVAENVSIMQSKVVEVVIEDKQITVSEVDGKSRYTEPIELPNTDVQFDIPVGEYSDGIARGEHSVDPNFVVDVFAEDMTNFPSGSYDRVKTEWTDILKMVLVNDVGGTLTHEIDIEYFQEPDESQTVYLAPSQVKASFGSIDGIARMAFHVVKNQNKNTTTTGVIITHSEDEFDQLYLYTAMTPP